MRELRGHIIVEDSTGKRTKYRNVSPEIKKSPMKRQVKTTPMKRTVKKTPMKRPVKNTKKKVPSTLSKKICISKAEEKASKMPKCRVDVVNMTTTDIIRKQVEVKREVNAHRLGQKIRNMPLLKIAQAVEIIKENEPRVITSSTGEIDFTLLSDATLSALQSFINPDTTPLEYTFKKRQLDSNQQIGQVSKLQNSLPTGKFHFYIMIE